MYMIKAYIIKIQSRNLTHDHRLSAAQKVSFQMILKNKVKKYHSSGSNFLSRNRDRDCLQEYWANTERNLYDLLDLLPDLLEKASKDHRKKEMTTNLWYSTICHLSTQWLSPFSFGARNCANAHNIFTELRYRKEICTCQVE